MGYTEFVVSQNPTYESPWDIPVGFDEYLERVLYVDYIHYGCKTLEAHSYHPVIDMNTFYELGNWYVRYVTNGPHWPNDDMTSFFTVAKYENYLIQMVPRWLDVYYRYSEVDDNGRPIEWSPWLTKSNLDCPVYIGNEEPVPEKNYCIWIDISYPATPVFRAYHPDLGWFSIGSLIDVLFSEIYDEDNRRQDIFWYFEKINGIVVPGEDEEWIQASPLDLEKDRMSLYNLRARFLNHFKLGHLSEAERKILDSLLSVPEINHLVELCKQQIFQYLQDKIDQLQIELIRQIHFDSVESFFDHFGDELIHTTDFRTGWWNSKAEGDHTHYLDGRVFISADDVIEGYVDLERMPDTAIERLTKVLTHEQRFALKRKQVQNGDTVFVYEENDVYEQGLYLVYDMYNLNNDAGWIYYRCRCIANIDFADIWRLPNTLAGYRISDGNLVIKADVVDDESGEITREFVYPYRAKDMSMNYYLTTAVMNMNIYFTKMLDEIEAKMMGEDPTKAIWPLALDQVEILNKIRDAWDPYRRIKDEYVRDAYNINAERYRRIEARYKEIFGIAYDINDHVPLAEPPALPEDVTDNEERYEEFLKRQENLPPRKSASELYDEIYNPQ